MMVYFNKTFLPLGELMLRAGPLLGLLCPQQATPEGSVNPTRHPAT